MGGPGPAGPVVGQGGGEVFESGDHGVVGVAEGVAEFVGESAVVGGGGRADRACLGKAARPDDRTELGERLVVGGCCQPPRRVDQLVFYCAEIQIAGHAAPYNGTENGQCNDRPGGLTTGRAGMVWRAGRQSWGWDRSPEGHQARCSSSPPEWILRNRGERLT